MVVIGAAAFICLATLTPSTENLVPPWCVSCAWRSRGLVANLVVNFFLFAPLGVGLWLTGVRAPGVALAALVASLFVETLQAYVIAGRIANVVDVAANTMGAAAAASAAPWWRSVVAPSVTTARRLALASLGAVIAIVWASAWALTPAVPDAPLVVRGVDARARPTRPARVLYAVVDGRAIRGRDTVRMAGPHAHPFHIGVALQAPRSQGVDEPALRLSAGRRPFVRLGIEDDEIKLELRRKGTAARLLSPSIRLPRPAVQMRPAGIDEIDTLLIRAVVAPWRMSLAVRARAMAPRELEVRLHPLAGWALLASNPREPRLAELLTALWTGALVFPAAYWAAAAGPWRRSIVSAVVSLSTISVWTIGAAVGAPPPPLTAITTLVVAGFAGWRLQHTVASMITPRGRLVGSSSSASGGGR